MNSEDSKPLVLDESKAEVENGIKKGRARSSRKRKSAKSSIASELNKAPQEEITESLQVKEENVQAPSEPLDDEKIVHKIIQTDSDKELKNPVARRSSRKRKSAKSIASNLNKVQKTIQIESEKELKNFVARLQVEKAVSSLRNWLENQKEEKESQLIEKNDIFYIVFSFENVSESLKVNGLRVSLPHSLYPLNSGHQVCLFLGDANEKAYKNLKQAIMKDELSGVTKVLGVRELNKNYKSLESRRLLSASYELFLSEQKIFKMLPRLLGNEFFKSKRHPEIAQVTIGKLPHVIRHACDSSLFYIDGDYITVRTARVSQSDEEVVDNAMAVIAKFSRSHHIRLSSGERTSYEHYLVNLASYMKGATFLQPGSINLPGSTCILNWRLTVKLNISSQMNSEGTKPLVLGKSKAKVKDSIMKLGASKSLKKKPVKSSIASLSKLNKAPQEKITESLQVKEEKVQAPSEPLDKETIVQKTIQTHSEKKELKNLVPREQAEKAVSSLRKWLLNQKDETKPQLLEKDDMFYIVFSFKKIPESRKVNGHKISIPHSLYPLNSGFQVCLILGDSNEEAYKKLKHAIKKDETLGVTKVMGVSKLKKNHKPFESRRMLCGSYDLFLSEYKLIKILPGILGRTFFKSKKHPTTVQLNKGNLHTIIRSACDSTLLHINGGDCSTVRTARVSQSDEEVVDNAMAVIAGVVDKIPSQWKNIRSIYIKTLESVSLPLFVSLPDFKMKLPEIKNE